MKLIKIRHIQVQVTVERLTEKSLCKEFGRKSNDTVECVCCTNMSGGRICISYYYQGQPMRHLFHSLKGNDLSKNPFKYQFNFIIPALERKRVFLMF
ncbi:UNVERIFIED_CONTAM: hypothetical protein NCL1_29134 [Trichonephila clavipes]